MAKARGLGRGLSSLIPERPAAAPLGPVAGGVQNIAIQSIQANPYQPRRRFRDDELSELAQSVKNYGIIQPILVRPVAGGYQLVAGERRVRAARLVGLEEIPAVVRELSDRDSIEMALVENLQRSDLDPIEESHAYRQLIEEFNWTQEEIGARVGKSRSHVANFLRLLQLDPSIQQMVSDQLLTVAHGKELLSVDAGRRSVLAERCVQEGWTVKQLQAAIKRGEVPPAKTSTRDDVHLKSVEAGLRRRFGTKVMVRGDSNKGRIEIPYRSLEELERLLTMLDEESTSDPGDFVV